MLKCLYVHVWVAVGVLQRVVKQKRGRFSPYAPPVLHSGSLVRAANQSTFNKSPAGLARRKGHSRFEMVRTGAQLSVGHLL